VTYTYVGPVGTASWSFNDVSGDSLTGSVTTYSDPEIDYSFTATNATASSEDWLVTIPAPVFPTFATTGAHGDFTSALTGTNPSPTVSLLTGGEFSNIPDLQINGSGPFLTLWNLTPVTGDGSITPTAGTSVTGSSTFGLVNATSMALVFDFVLSASSTWTISGKDVLDPAPVPEPTSVTLLGTVALAMFFITQRRKRAIQ